MITDKTPKIRVLVRKRPISKKQLARGDKDIVGVENHQTIVVKEQKVKVDLTPYTDQYRFNFDGAYDETSTNQQIYEQSIKPLVQCAFNGARVSCFAYGQTGSGKTFTMLGDGNQVYGLYLLAACDIFEQVVQKNDLQVWVSFYEIYCGKLFDLLNNRNVLIPRQDAKSNVNIVGLSERKITSVKNLMQAIQFGTTSRVTAQNGTNTDSSRSHAILQISLKNGKKIHGKISFIDLAGSQRAADHADQIQKQTRIDGAEINKSLLALKQCIRALDLNKNHTPFRGSKLTMVLKDSFTGYCKTVMIGNISPNSSSSQNTLNTLKYADRVKQLKKPNKDACEPIDGDNLDQLNKQLMLPRQLVNHHRFKSTQKSKYEQMPNKSSVDTPTKQVQIRNNNTIYLPPSKKPTGTKSDGKPQLNNSKDSINSRPPSRKQKQNKSSNTQNQPSRKQRSQTMASKTPILIQQDQPSQQQQPIKYQSIQQLSRKHSDIVTSLVAQQQKLLKDHQIFVNNTIELVKKQMKLLRNCDDPDSNMQEYLIKFDRLLEKQMENVAIMRNKVKKVLKNCNQSQKVQKIYLNQMGKLGQLGGEQDNLLLDNDDHLFKN